MLRVALVGNIASGKSTVEKLLKELHFKVLDSDLVCHNLLTSLDEIKSEFKGYDVFDDGQISREKLGNLVFRNSELKQKLEGLLYPSLRREITNFFLENKTDDIVFVAAPLLFEAKMENLFDRILFVYCDDSLRKTRLIQRNGYTEEYAQIRMDAQMCQDEKISMADYILYNNSTLENLQCDLAKLIEQIH